MSRIARCVSAATVLVALLVVVVASVAALPPNPFSDGIAAFREAMAKREPVPMLDHPSAPSDEPLAADAVSPWWSWFAYQVYSGGSWDIRVAQQDNSGARTLVSNPAADMHPRLNPQCTRVVFESNRDGNYELYIVNVDGSDLRRLTLEPATDVSPAWSYDGSRVLFSANRRGNYELYSMDPDGISLVQLTDDPAQDDMPTMSPDGTKIVWVRSVTNSTSALWVAKPDGTSAHAVTPPLPYAQHPMFAPDSRRIAFDLDMDGDGLNELAVLDGASLTMVYNPPDGTLVDVWMGAWSPNSNVLAHSLIYLVVVDGQVYIDSTYVAFASVDGSWNSVLSAAGSRSMSPDWRLLDLTPPTPHLDPIPSLVRSSEARISWGAVDTQSGVRNYTVEYRDAGVSAWSPWQTGTRGTSAAFPNLAGHTFTFRVKATDNVGNESGWITHSPQQSMTLYTWQTKSLVLDTRDRPVPGAQIIGAPQLAAPAFAGETGVVTACVSITGSQSMRATQSGYGASPVLTVAVTSDLSGTVHYMTPVDDGVQNGGFEAGLDSWTSVGAVPPSPTQDPNHSGAQSVWLGQPAAMTAAVRAPLEGDARLLIDRAGGLHMLSVVPREGSVSDVLYKYKPVTGTWPVSATAITSILEYNGTLTAAVDPHLGIHLAWQQGWYPESAYTDIYFAYKAPGDATCGAIEDLTNDSARWYVVYGPSIGTDAAGHTHLLYRLGGILMYRERVPGRGWSGEQELDGGMLYSGCLVVDVSGNVHVAYSNYGQQWYMFRPAGGEWRARERVGQYSGGATVPVLAVARDLTPHVLWYPLPYPALPVDSGSPTYNVRLSDGAWSADFDLRSVPPESGHGVWRARMAVDAYGIVHIAYSASLRAGKKLLIMEKAPGGDWSQIVAVAGDGVPTAFAFDASGVAHLIYYPGYNPSQGNYYTRSQQRAVTVSSGLAQAITIPSDAHRPTLSFLAYGERSGYPGRDLTAWLTDGLGTTIVLTASVPSGRWTHYWADVSAWIGKTVTVTLSLAQPARQPYGRVWLDEITVGSWYSPRVAWISPNWIRPGSAVLLTIHGENFVDMPTVRLGDVALAGVERVSDEELRVQLPGSLAPGAYTLWVMNPAGQTAALPRGIRIGYCAILPVISRQP